jgi:hypothetical protein
MTTIKEKLQIPIESQRLFLIHSRNIDQDQIRLDTDRTRHLRTIDFLSGQLVDVYAEYQKSKR